MLEQDSFFFAFMRVSEGMRWTKTAKVIIDIHFSDRSYILQIPGNSRKIIRNKHFIRKVPQDFNKELHSDESDINEDEQDFDEADMNFKNTDDILIYNEKCALNPCKDPHGMNIKWVLCEGCDLWYHLICLGINDVDIHPEREFYCPSCKDA